MRKLYHRILFWLHKPDWYRDLVALGPHDMLRINDPGHAKTIRIVLAPRADWCKGAKIYRATYQDLYTLPVTKEFAFNDLVALLRDGLH